MKASAPLLPSSSKNNPFRKSNFMRSQSISQGGDSSPGSTESKRSKNRQNIKSRQQQPDLIVEEGFQLADQVNEDEQNDSGNHMQTSGGYDMPSPLKNMDLPEVFEKYLLTTDIPFFGVRTTKAKIEPVKTPKTALNSKNGDDLSGGLSAKKFIPVRSKSRIQPSQSRVLVPLESKPSVDRSGKKAFEKESHSNVEKDSVKHDSPSKNSLDAEAEVKEKPAFITEAPRSQNSMEKQGSDDRSQEPQDSGFREAEDSDYSPSSEKNRQKALKSWKVPKTPQSPEKPQYDPWAVLNKIRNKEFAVPKSYDHGFNGYVTETDSLTRSKTSQPRDFTVMRSKKMNLFEGIPYVPYDVFLRQDANMQNVMLKDLLKILLDKAKSLKNLFHDNYRMDRIMKNIEEAEQSALNLHTEETIGLLNAVSSLIMQEFRDSVNQIGIKASPIFDNPNLRISGWENEVDRFYDNCNIFLDSIDHLRDCIDCYYVMSRQKDRKPIADIDCSDLLQFIARSRYNLGQLYEAFRVIEKHVDAKLIWDAQNDPAKIKEKMRKLQTQSGMNNKLKADTYKLLQELLQNKFNINRNKIAATRESKVVLNQEAEDEKFLTILQNQKQLKKKGGKALVDNRKLIILNRLLNPIEDPQIQVAIKIAQEKTQVQLGRDLVEYMASKAKVFEMKANINRDLPLKNNLEKILSNKNLTHLCFDFTDKEPQEIMHKLTTANKTDEMKELVNNVFSHTKTKRHLGCLFDKESSNHKHLHLHEPKSSVGIPGTPGTPGTQLPKLEKHLRKTFLQTR